MSLKILLANRSSRRNFVKTVFGIPAWYLLSEREENKLFKYIREARNIEEAHLYRVMDGSTIYNEQFCFFCALDMAISINYALGVTLFSGTKLGSVES